MGTEIKVLYKKLVNTKEKADFEEPFYCKEAPFEVLKELYPKFHIQIYNTIETWGVLESLPREGEYSRLRENGFFIHGLSIKNSEPQNGMNILGNLSDYKMDISIPNGVIGNEEKIVRLFIERYLIEKKIIDAGSITQNYLHQTKIFKYGKQRAIQYVRERKNQIDEKKEECLEDILEYGKVALGDNFNLRKLERMSRRVAREIPTEFYPSKMYFATLKPSRSLNFKKNQ